MEDIVAGRSREVHIGRMWSYSGPSLSVTIEEVLNSLKRQGEFNKDRTLAVDLTAGSEDHVVKMKWVRPGDEKTTWESVPTIYANTPKYLS